MSERKRLIGLINPMADDNSYTDDTRKYTLTWIEDWKTGAALTKRLKELRILVYQDLETGEFTMSLVDDWQELNRSLLEGYRIKAHSIDVDIEVKKPEWSKVVEYYESDITPRRKRRMESK